MAEFPHPVRLLQHLGWVAVGKAEGAIIAIIRAAERRVREDYAREGDRDD